MKTVLYLSLLCVFIFSMTTARAQQTKEFCIMKVTITHATSFSAPDSRIVITKAAAEKPVVINLISFGGQGFSVEEENKNNQKIAKAFADLYSEGYKLLSATPYSLPQNTVEGYNYIFEK